jgi:protease-4
MKHRHRVWLSMITPFCLAGLALGQVDQIERLKELGKSALGGGESTKQIAYFKLRGPLAETPVTMPPLFEKHPPMSLKGLLERFKEARIDANVVAIVLDIQEAAVGLGQLEEIHTAMRQFAAVDKPVYVHADSLQTVTYALATGASHISIVPTGDLWLTGFYGEMPYLRGALDKVGWTPDIEHCGDYKNAGEVFTHTGPSDESKKMTKWILDGLYGDFVKRIAEGRKMTPEKVRELIDGGPYSAEEALKLGLIDSVQHRQDFVSDLKKRHGGESKFVTDYGNKDDMEVPEDPFAMFSFFMKLFNPSPKIYTEPSVAIVYVEGAISTGEGESSLFGGSEGAYSTTIRRALDKAAEDDTVKAVVMRVDSPGGSALASEIILDASRRVAAKKPLIVSMGNVAGSGGYYVTCAAGTIFADANTITASIGVVAGKMVTTGMWEKLGVNWHVNQRGKRAGMMSSATPFNEEQRTAIRKYMNVVYDVFKGHVAKAREGKLTKPLDEMTGGRVFTGAQALELGLVDKIGGLEDSIKFAAQKAGLSDYDIRVIPEPPTIFDMFMDKSDDDAVAGIGMAGMVDMAVAREILPLLAHTDPLRVRAVLRQFKLLSTMQKESILLAMPGEIVIH